MSTKQTGKAKQRARRSVGASTRPGNDLVMFDDLCRTVLKTQGREVLASDDPLQAELWVSHLLGLFGSHPLLGEPDPVGAIGARLVSVARRARTPEAKLCLRALASVAEGRLARQANVATRELLGSGTPAPPWIDGIGAAAPTQAWRATDLCGDQDSVMIGFAYPDGVEHSIVVLIDHPLGGIAKDATVLGPLDDVLAHWRVVPDIELVEEPVELAAGRVVAAMEWTDRTIDAPVTEDLVDTAALLRARLGPLAGDLPEREPLSDDAREDVVRAFLNDPAGVAYAHDTAAWFILDSLVTYRCDYHGGDPLRWSTGTALSFLLEFVPRKLSACDATLARAPEVLRAWVPWAARQAGLPEAHIAETLEAIVEIEGEFERVVADDSTWGVAKRLVMEMLAGGIDPNDTEAANTWLTNTLSDRQAERHGGGARSGSTRQSRSRSLSSGASRATG